MSADKLAPFELSDRALLKKRLKEKYGDEEVLACRSNLASDVDDKFTVRKKDLYSKLARQSSYIKRCDAEYNPSYLQLIAYVIVSDAAGEKFYVSRRKAGEERLQGKWSFFGGHINPCDMGLDTVKNAAERELHEEVACKECGEMEYVGFVRDNAGPTPEHLGVVFQAHVKNASIKEKDNLEGQWMAKKDLFAHYNDFEAWGKYILDYFYEETIKYA